MGRRKRAQKIIKTQKKAEVAKVFKCPYCNHDDAVEVKLNKQRKTASLMCKICAVRYQTTIHYLSEPIDVFCEWLDASYDKDQAEDENEYAEHDDRS